MDNDFLEKLIIKSALESKRYLVLIADFYKPEFFENKNCAETFKVIKEVVKQYNEIPSKDVIINSCDIKQDFFNELNSIDFDITKSYDFLIDKSNEYLKNKALHKAISESIDIYEKKDDPDKIRAIIEKALSLDLNFDIGLQYFATLGERLKRIFNESIIKVPSFYPTLDEIICGGFPTHTMSIVYARIHGYKSLWLVNLCCRMILNGYNAVLFTLEMSEEMFAQRVDSILSTMNINHIYIDKTKRKDFVIRLKEAKEKENRGELFIKQYPTGRASVSDFRKYIRELEIRDIKPNIVMADYINLMKPEYKNKTDLYMDMKTIAEEYRALGFEFKIPVLSVSQINREGMKVNVNELDFDFSSESLGIPGAVDFQMMFGSDPETMIYESQVIGKITKNRFGGRVGDKINYLVDPCSLKMYDESELDIWENDAKISGGKPKVYKKE